MTYDPPHIMIVEGRFYEELADDIGSDIGISHAVDNLIWVHFHSHGAYEAALAFVEGRLEKIRHTCFSSNALCHRHDGGCHYCFILLFPFAGTSPTSQPIYHLSTRCESGGNHRQFHWMATPANEQIGR